MEELILKGTAIEDILDGMDWRGFEDICSKILEENGWTTKKNFRFKTKSRHEIDILAARENKVLAIDCKHWGIRPGKKSQLRVAAEKQSKRASELGKIRFLDQVKPPEVFPLIITWFEEDIIKEKDVWIVPISKLNGFLLDIESYMIQQSQEFKVLF